jgi:GAF domain-containing protein
VLARWNAALEGAPSDWFMSSSATTPEKEIRILIADDHPVVREGLMAILALESDLKVVGQAHDGEEACRLYDQLSPDVLILDLRMPRKDGLEGFRREVFPAAWSYRKIGGFHGAARTLRARTSDSQANGSRQWSNNDPSWVALQMQRPFVLDDPVRDPQLGYTPAQRARFSASGIRALLLIPLVFGGQLIGCLSVRIGAKRQVDDGDLAFAQSLAQ